MRERIEAGVGLAVSILGLAAYLYLLGGLVWWLRFTAARLPADQAVSAISSKRLLATGLKAFVFEAAILAVLMLVALVAWRGAKRVSKRWRWGEASGTSARGEKEKAEHQPIAWSTILFGICFGVVLLAVAFELPHWTQTGGGVPTPYLNLLGGAIGAFFAALFDERSNRTAQLESAWVRWALSIPLGLLAITMFSAPAGVAILVLIALAHLSGGLNELPSVDDPLQLVPAVLIVGGGFGLVAAAYEATPPVSLVRVAIVTSSNEGIVGGYVGETSGEMMVAQCKNDPADPKISPRPPKLKVIPKGDITDTYLGGPHYAFDYGKKPSIFDLLKHYLGRSEIGETLDTISIDPRGSRLVCGNANPFRVVNAIDDGRSGTAEERIILHGAGVVSLGGEGVATQQLTVEKGGEVHLPIVPMNAARAELGLIGQTDVKVWTQFESEGGDASTTTQQVHLVRRSTYRANAR